MNVLFEWTKIGTHQSSRNKRTDTHLQVNPLYNFSFSKSQEVSEGGVWSVQPTFRRLSCTGALIHGNLFHEALGSDNWV